MKVQTIGQRARILNRKLFIKEFYPNILAQLNTITNSIQKLQLMMTLISIYYINSVAINMPLNTKINF